MPGGQILQNIAAVCSVSPKHLHVQAVSILLVACIIQIIANTLVLEFGLQLNLFLANICLSSKTLIWNTLLEQNLHLESLLFTLYI